MTHLEGWDTPLMPGDLRRPRSGARPIWDPRPVNMRFASMPFLDDGHGDTHGVPDPRQQRQQGPLQPEPHPEPQPSAKLKAKPMPKTRPSSPAPPKTKRKWVMVPLPHGYATSTFWETDYRQTGMNAMVFKDAEFGEFMMSVIVGPMADGEHHGSQAVVTIPEEDHYICMSCFRNCYSR